MKTFYHDILAKIRKKALLCGRNPEEIELIVASKGRSLESLSSAYEEGARLFGESRVQEAINKVKSLPPDCVWHMIGSLQKNKVAKALELFNWIHSVDSVDLARKISLLAEKKGKEVSILLEVNTSFEPNKHGFFPEQLQDSLLEINQFSSLNLRGLMTLAPLTDDPEVIRQSFRLLKSLRDHYRSLTKDPQAFSHLSMGMSHDYLIAIEEGATLLRIGRSIFDSNPIE